MPKISMCNTLEEALALLKDEKETIMELHSHALIGDKGATALGEAMKENKVLQIAIIPGQGIGPVGAAALGKSLNKNMW